MTAPGPRPEGVDAAHAVVSVCIPTYNRADRLVRAVESVLAQDHPAIEVVISDNHSTDSTEAWCRSLADADPRVQYVRNDRNLGPTANFNQARARATGAFVMWLGDDDRLEPDYVRTSLAELERDPSLVLVTGSVRYLAEGAYTHTAEPVELADDDGQARVLRYYRSVTDNGTFYGLTPRWAADAASPMPDLMGNDWFLLAELAWLGSFRTVTTTAVDRDTGGATRSLRDVARSAGFSRFEAEAPQLAIACSAGRSILRSPVYADLGWRRAVLAARVTGVLYRRLLPEAAGKLVKRFRGGRSR